MVLLLKRQPPSFQVSVKFAGLQVLKFRWFEAFGVSDFFSLPYPVGEGLYFLRNRSRKCSISSSSFWPP